MKHVITLAFIVCLLVALGTSESSGQHLGKVHERMFLMRDSLQLHAWIHESPDGDRAPLFICLPQRRANHRSFDRFYIDLTRYVRENSKEGLILPHVMVLDLRGHGASTQRGDSVLSYETMSTEEYQMIPQDVAELLTLLDSYRERPREDRLLTMIGKGPRTLIGASIGANSAIMATELNPHVDRVVMLSPGEDYRGLAPMETVQKFAGDMLIVTCKKDTYSHTSSMRLQKAAGDRCDLMKWGGSEHGTGIINNVGAAMQQLLEWLFQKQGG